MYFQQNDFENKIDQGEKLQEPSQDRFRKSHLLLAMLIVISSIFMAYNICKFMYWGYHAERGPFGSIITIVCFLAYDIFIVRTIFFKCAKQSIYKFKLRSVFATTSALIAILLTYMLWAAENSFGTLISIPLFCLCANFILNFILNRLQPAKTQMGNADLREQPLPVPPMSSPQREYPPMEEGYLMRQTPPELWH